MAAAKKHPKGQTPRKETIAKKSKAPAKRSRPRRSSNAKLLGEHWTVMDETIPHPGRASNHSPTFVSADLMPQVQSRLLSLPGEIRLQIWKYTLFNKSDDVITPYELKVRGPRWKFRSGVPGRDEASSEIKYHARDAIESFNTLSLTCHQIYLDIVPGGLLYQLHRFNFFYPRSLVRFLSSISDASRNAIRDIKLAFPRGGEGFYPKVIAPEALSALCMCTSLEKLSLIIGTSTGDRYHAEADYTHGGADALRAVEVLTTRLAECGLIGLKDFDILIWDPWPWQREAEGAVVVGSGQWTEDVKISWAARTMTARQPGQVYRDCWSDETKQKLEMMVGKLRVQVTQPRSVDAM